MYLLQITDLFCVVFSAIYRLVKIFEPLWRLKIPQDTFDRRRFFMKQFPTLHRLYMERKAHKQDCHYPIEYASRYQVKDFDRNLAEWSEQNAVVKQNKKFYLIILNDGTVLFHCKKKFDWV